VDAYNEIKLSHKYRYIIVKFNNDKTALEVEKTGEPSATYDDFTSQLPENECRYGVFDLEYSKDDDGVRQKILFFVWAPDTARIKDKMLTASTKDAVKKKFVGHSAEIQATEPSEYEYNYVLGRVQSISR